MDREYIYDVNGLNGVEKTVAKARRVLEILGHDSPNLKGLVDPDAKIVEMASFLGRNPGIDDLMEYSDQLRAAFYLYQGSAYRDINPFLRKNHGLNRSENPTFKEMPTNSLDIEAYEDDFFFEEDDFDFGKMPEYTFRTVDTIDALDLLIESQKPLEEDTVLYHGSDISMYKDMDGVNEIEDLIALNYSGDSHHVTQDAYLSTTLNISGRFCDESPVITAISVPKGTHILGPFGGEGEILLGRGYELEFVKSEIIDGKVFVYTKLHERKKIVTKSEDEIQITDEVDAVDAILKDNEKNYSHHQGL